jgi:hypothetical protein
VDYVSGYWLVNEVFRLPNSFDRMTAQQYTEAEEPTFLSGLYRIPQ